MINFPIDFVFPYVDNTKEIWRQSYRKYCVDSGQLDKIARIDTERYFDLGLLRFIFRGIDKFMPWIRKVHMIVSDKEQVPDWVDKEKVNIILHKNIIPSQYLPTFNSTTIEMFLHKIPGLSEHFLYSNDDLFLLNDLKPEDFFTEFGYPRFNLEKITLSKNPSMFNIVSANCFHHISQRMGKRYDIGKYIAPEHDIHPLTLTHCRAAFNLIKDLIYPNISEFRTSQNHNQYIYIDYAFNKNQWYTSDRKFLYFSLKKDPETVIEFIKARPQILCLNDTAATDRELYTKRKYDIQQAFEVAGLNNQSKYELFIDDSVRQTVENNDQDELFYLIESKENEKKTVPRITIGIPAYNVSQYIENCLKSIPRRSDIELIIINDHSSDDTQNKILNNIKCFDTFKVLEMKENSGAATCRNIILDKAQGEYIFFLDADDTIDSEAFNKVIDMELVDQYILTPRFIRNDGLKYHPRILQGSFIRRDFIGSVRHTDYIKCFEDVDFKKKLLAAHPDLKIEEIQKFSDEVVYKYNLPRIGSVTWEHYKNRGLPGYQTNEDNWEKYYEGKLR